MSYLVCQCAGLDRLPAGSGVTALANLDRRPFRDLNLDPRDFERIARPQALPD